MKSVVLHFGPKNSPCIWATFDSNHVTKNFQKSPNLVTLVSVNVTIESHSLYLYFVILLSYLRNLDPIL